MVSEQFITHYRVVCRKSGTAITTIAEVIPNQYSERDYRLEPVYRNVD